MSYNNDLNRRHFLKMFAFATASSQLGAWAWTNSVLGDIQAAGSPATGLFRMNLNDFPALQTDNGSVRLKVTGMSATFPQIIVTRSAGSVFHAVSSYCTHMGCTVNTFDASQGVLVCPCHGSQFKADGSVAKNPATEPLARYATQFDGASLLAIEIPGLGYSIKSSVVQPAGGASRLSLSFPTVAGLNYEVRFKTTFGATDWSPVMFSPTLDGQAEVTSLVGDGAEATVYLERTATSGFYAVIRY